MSRDFDFSGYVAKHVAPAEAETSETTAMSTEPPVPVAPSVPASRRRTPEELVAEVLRRHDVHISAHDPLVIATEILYTAAGDAIAEIDAETRGVVKQIVSARADLEAHARAVVAGLRDAISGPDPRSMRSQVAQLLADANRALEAKADAETRRAAGEMRDIARAETMAILREVDLRIETAFERHAAERMPDGYGWLRRLVERLVR